MEPKNIVKIRSELNLPNETLALQVHFSLLIMPGEKRKVLWFEKNKSSNFESYTKDLLRDIDIIFYYTSLYREDIMVNALHGSENMSLIKENSNIANERLLIQ
jgi:hypothetical protein